MTTPTSHGTKTTNGLWVASLLPFPCNVLEGGGTALGMAKGPQQPISMRVWLMSSPAEAGCGPATRDRRRRLPLLGRKPFLHQSFGLAKGVCQASMKGWIAESQVVSGFVAEGRTAVRGNPGVPERWTTNGRHATAGNPERGSHVSRPGWWLGTGRLDPSPPPRPPPGLPLLNELFAKSLRFDPPFQPL